LELVCLLLHAGAESIDRRGVAALQRLQGLDMLGRHGEQLLRRVGMLLLHGILVLLELLELAAHGALLLAAVRPPRPHGGLLIPNKHHGTQARKPHDGHGERGRRISAGTLRG